MKVIERYSTTFVVTEYPCVNLFKACVSLIDIEKMRDYKVAIVYDEDEDQYYVVDVLTHLILSSHLSVSRCIDWLYRSGFELIELKRKYDAGRYKNDINLWRSLLAHI